MGQGGALTLLFIFINPLLALAATISVISLYDCKSQPKHKGSGIRTTTHSDLRVVCVHSEKFEIICLALCITYPLSYERQNIILINLEFYKWLLFIECLHKFARLLVSFQCVHSMLATGQRCVYATFSYGQLMSALLQFSPFFWKATDQTDRCLPAGIQSSVVGPRWSFVMLLLSPEHDISH